MRRSTNPVSVGFGAHREQERVTCDGNSDRGSRHRPTTKPGTVCTVSTATQVRRLTLLGLTGVRVGEASHLGPGDLDSDSDGAVLVPADFTGQGPTQLDPDDEPAILLSHRSSFPVVAVAAHPGAVHHGRFADLAREESTPIQRRSLRLVSRASPSSTIPAQVASGSPRDDLLKVLEQDLRVAEEVGSPHTAVEVLPLSDVPDESDLESDDAVPVPVEDNSENEEGDRRRFTREIREALQSLDLVD